MLPHWQRQLETADQRAQVIGEIAACINLFAGDRVGKGEAVGVQGQSRGRGGDARVGVEAVTED